MIRLVLLLALSAHAAAPAKEKKTTMEWKGQNGGPAQAGHQVVTDVKGWEALWRVIGKDAPALDLKKHVAVAVFLGERPTGGWSVKFLDPVPKDGDVHLAYVVEGPKGFATQAFTAPFHVRALPRPAKGKLVVMEAASK